MLQIASTNEEKVTVVATPKTTSGRPAAIDGALRVTVVDGDVTVEQDAALPLQFKAVSGDAPGTSHLLVEADADLGAGVVTIQDTVEYVVAGAQAASFGLAAGVVEPK